MKNIMKKFLHITVAALLCAAAAASCSPNAHNNDNPVEVSLNGCDFDITILDCEHGYDRDSNYVFEGVWKDGEFRFGHYKLDKMTPNITKDNAITFRITSEDPMFEGVNASSSARCINIVQDGTDHTVYHLEWVAEGGSSIKFWNGEGETRKEISFRATSRKEIPLEGFYIRFGERTYDFMYARYDKVGYTLTNDPYREIVESTGLEQQRVNPANDSQMDFKDMIPVEIFPKPMNATAHKLLCTTYLGRTVQIGKVERDEKIIQANIENGLPANWLLNSFADVDHNGDFHDDKKQTIHPSDIRERKVFLYSPLKFGTVGIVIENINYKDYSNNNYYCYKIKAIN